MYRRPVPFAILRLYLFDVSDHPWIKEDGEAPDTPLDNAVLGRLKQFRAMNQFKKAALRVRVGLFSPCQ